jgi:uncharacterized phage protein (TIGR02218 family)
VKNLTPALEEHFGADVTTLATCWHLTLTDGTEMCFSDHDADIDFDGYTYLASAGVAPTTISHNSDLSVSNSEIMGFLAPGTFLGEVNSVLINEADVTGGRFDKASVRIFIVNYEDTTMGLFPVQSGTLGEIKLENSNKWTAEIRGPEQALATQIGKLYSITCRATLGDSWCTVNLTQYTKQGTVQSLPFRGNDRVNFVADVVEVDGYFNGGLLTWLTGKNAGLVMEVSDFKTGAFTMYLPMLNRIQAGDTFKAVKGCKKTKDACFQFGNVINFQGEPDIPGMNALLKDATKAASSPVVTFAQQIISDNTSSTGGA